MWPFSKSKKISSAAAKVTLMPGSDGEHNLQQKFDTRARALKFYDKQVINFLSPVMRDFIAKQEIMFIATADRHGECDCSPRFGRAGFVRVLNEKYLVYPEYRGNGVMASQGNISENPQIGMVFVDFCETTVGLHVNGKARLVENEALVSYYADLPADLIDEIQSEGNRLPERWIMVEVSEAYIHCSKHIPLMKKMDKSIDWGTDSDVAKRTDFFQLGDLSLYDRIGGDEAMDVVLDRFYRKVLMDDSVRHFFDDTNMVLQLQKQKNFLKLAFGGMGSNHPYNADNLRQAHQHLLAKGMNDGHFDQILKLLNDTLEELDVPKIEIDQMIETLETTRDAVMGR